MTNNTIKQLVEEVNKEMSSDRNRTSEVAEDSRVFDADTLLLIPKYAPFPQKHLISNLISCGYVVAGFGPEPSECDCRYYDLEDAQKLSSLLSLLDSFDEIYLYSPGFALMERVSQLMDDDLLPSIFLRSLRSGKKTGIFLESALGSMPQGLSRLLEKRLDKLCELGIKIHYATCEKIGKEDCSDNINGLLLEEDVIELYRQGRTLLQLDKGAIVTPLAADKASELGVELI